MPFATERLPRVLWTQMPAESLAAEGVDERDCQLAEKATFLKAEPGRTRFARFETKAVERPNFSHALVSEVRPPRAKSG